MQAVAARRRRAGWLIVLSLLVSGCGGYGDVSPTAYEYAKALFSITNRRAEAKLDQVAGQIEAEQAAGKLSESEAGWLMAIVDDARDGQWQAANQAARRIMEDQVR
jgi:hypothetical protein